MDPANPFLLCYDASEDASNAIRRAGSVLGGGPAVVVHAWRPPSAFMIPGRVIEEPHPLASAAAEFDASAAAEAERIASEGAELANACGFSATHTTVKDTRGAWPGIVRLADELDARAVVVGSHGRSSIRDTLLGTVSHGILHHCRRPVLVIPMGNPTEDAERSS